MRGWQVARVTIGAMLVLALLADIALTKRTLNNSPDAPDLQVVAIYAAGLFYGAMAVGAAIAGYILTRGLDRR